MINIPFVNGIERDRRMIITCLGWQKTIIITIIIILLVVVVVVKY